MTITSASMNQTPGSGKTIPPQLQKALGKVTEISSLPEITTKIVQMVEDPRSTARDMHDIVRTDPALAAKILKVVNSAFYGLPSQIASLDRAILMLGLSAVKNIALAASLSRMFKAEAVCDQFASRDLWKHSVAVGVCARELAKVSKAPQPDEAFVAGLVHDMGLIVEQQLFPAMLKSTAETCFNETQDFCAAETRIIGADHQALGGALAAKWKFPPGLRFTVAYHHEPRTLLPEFQKNAAMVCVADILCCQARYGFWLTAATQAISADLLAMADLSPDHIAKVGEELSDHVAEAEEIFTAG